MADRSNPSTFSIQILASENNSGGRYSFSNRALFLPVDTIREVLDLLYQNLHNFYSVFKDLKSSKKEKI